MRNASLGTVVLLAVTAGCAVTQPQNTPAWQKQETDPVTGAAYWMYVPAAYRDDKPAPLVVTCHGTPPFDVSEHHVRELKMLGEQNGCIVLSPALIGTDGILGNGPISAMLENERRILGLISMAGYRYNVDMANIMITGFSGGGFPVYWVGIRNPEVFSCIVPRSCNFSEANLDGWYPQAAVKMIDAFIYYGSNDPLTIKVQSDNGIRYLQSKGFRVAERVVPGIGHQRRPEVAMRFFREHWRTPRPSQPGLTRR